jgi:plasmid stabilization system protein ParE
MDFPQLGRVVPEFEHQAVREIVEPPYRIIYRVLHEDEIHILTIHHGARQMPDTL